jgi:hypothetical protein
MNRIMRSNPNFLKANPFATMVAPRAFTPFAPCRSFATAATAQRDAIDVSFVLALNKMCYRRLSAFSGLSS